MRCRKLASRKMLLHRQDTSCNARCAKRTGLHAKRAATALQALHEALAITAINNIEHSADMICQLPQIRVQLTVSLYAILQDVCRHCSASIA